MFFPHNDTSEVKRTFPLFPLLLCAVWRVIAPMKQKQKQTDLFPVAVAAMIPVCFADNQMIRLLRWSSFLKQHPPDFSNVLEHTGRADNAHAWLTDYFEVFWQSGTVSMGDVLSRYSHIYKEFFLSLEIVSDCVRKIGNFFVFCNQQSSWCFTF